MKRFGLWMLIAMFGLAACDRSTEDHTRGASSTCEFHQVAMTKTNVPLRYGLIRFNAWGTALEAASKNGFPHAQDQVLAGCLVSSSSPTQAVIYVCSKCQLAQQQWINEHPSSK